MCYAVHGAPCTRARPVPSSAGHGWPSVPVAHENTVFARITLLADTVFARISLLAGWREGTLYAAPYLGSLERKFA
ncbi:hypothetical protein [Desulfosporosinus sp.]|uniref:hypothetical protein n=1 Tax=Desulfosporosinus sp. TaxID=157907 RepID=UPI0026065743|nr:hypothetical protein [Desulfosporosinus sp.]